MHKRVIEASQNHHRCQAQWQALIEKALYLEDVEIAETTNQLPVKWMKKSIYGRAILYNGLFNKIKLPHSVRFFWHVKLKRLIFQVILNKHLIFGL